MNNIYNTKLNSILQSGTVALADKVRKLEAQRNIIIPLHTGDPDFATPEIIVHAAMDALKAGFTHYSNSRGLDELRKAISENLIQKGLIEYAPSNEIIITNGGIHAYFLALSSVIEQGDEVIIQDPTWMSHFNIIKMTGGVPVSIPVCAEENWCMRPEAIVASITPKTKAIVINSPSNPTGGIYDKETLEGIIEIALKYDLFIISDEVYDQIILDETEKFTSIASYKAIKDRLLLCNSFSKTYAMTGWRIGYLCCPSKILNQTLKVSQCTITNVAPFIQKAAFIALTDPAIPNHVTNMVKEYRYRAEKVMEIYMKYPLSPIKLFKPRGAFYFFADIRGLNMESSQDVAESLLEKISVATVPGSVFGKNGEGYLRLTIAAPREAVIEGFTRLFQLKYGNG